MAENNNRAPEPVAAPPSGLLPFEGATFHETTLAAVAGIAGAVTAAVLFTCLVGEWPSMQEMLFIASVGLVGGTLGGTYAGIISGQIARLIFHRKERRYYQMTGAVVMGAVCGCLSIFGLFWLLMSAGGD